MGGSPSKGSAGAAGRSSVGVSASSTGGGDGGAASSDGAGGVDGAGRGGGGGGGGRSAIAGRLDCLGGGDVGRVSDTSGARVSNPAGSRWGRGGTGGTGASRDSTGGRAGGGGGGGDGAGGGGGGGVSVGAGGGGGVGSGGRGGGAFVRVGAGGGAGGMIAPRSSAAEEPPAVGVVGDGSAVSDAGGSIGPGSGRSPARGLSLACGASITGTVVIAGGGGGATSSRSGIADWSRNCGASVGVGSSAGGGMGGAWRVPSGGPGGSGVGDGASRAGSPTAPSPWRVGSDRGASATFPTGGAGGGAAASGGALGSSRSCSVRPSVGSAFSDHSTSTAPVPCFWDSLAALRRALVSLLSSFFDFRGAFPAVVRTPAAARAQAMQKGGLSGPNEYTRHSGQNSLPHARHTSPAASNWCFAQRPSIRFHVGSGMVVLDGT